MNAVGCVQSKWYPKLHLEVNAASLKICGSWSYELSRKSKVHISDCTGNVNELRHDKTNKVTLRPAKTQISLGIRPVCSESLLSAWRKLESLTTHWAQAKTLILVFAGRTLILLVFSRRGSNICSYTGSQLYRYIFIVSYMKLCAKAKEKYLFVSGYIEFQNRDGRLDLYYFYFDQTFL